MRRRLTRILALLLPRLAIGAGLGLVLGRRSDRVQRRAAVALVAAGVLATLSPLVMRRRPAVVGVIRDEDIPVLPSS